MAREIVLDTETTGLEPHLGHRIIEIACVELEGYVPTGRCFHCYVDPGRDIDPEAQRVHGLSRAFLSDKPAFGHPEVADALEAFIADAPVIAHNAAFDRRFIDHERERLGRAAWPSSRWIDSLGLAQTRFPGAPNSLDALCKRFRISLAEREKHGALVDAQLLAQVYLELRGGRETSLAFEVSTPGASGRGLRVAAAYGPRPRPLTARLSPAEAALHAAFVETDLGGDALWAAWLPREALVAAL